MIISWKIQIYMISDTLVANERWPIIIIDSLQTSSSWKHWWRQSIIPSRWPTCKGKSGFRNDKKWQSWEEENYQPAKENGTHKQRQSQGLVLFILRNVQPQLSACCQSQRCCSGSADSPLTPKLQVFDSVCSPLKLWLNGFCGFDLSLAPSVNSIIALI